MSKKKDDVTTQKPMKSNVCLLTLYHIWYTVDYRFSLVTQVDSVWSPAKMIIPCGLFFTFSYLASGDSMNGLAMRFRLGNSAVQEIIKNTCDAIWEELAPTELKPPTTED